MACLQIYQELLSLVTFLRVIQTEKAIPPLLTK